MSSNTESYKQAIDILMAGTFDAKAVAVELAKNYPTIFVRLAASASAPKEDAWMLSVRAKLVGGQKVEAIKEIRGETGLGLKEAKDMADNAQNRLLMSNPQLSYYDGAAVLHDPQQIRWVRGIVGS